MGIFNALLSAGRTLKNVNTGGRGLSGLARGESWIRPMKVDLTTGEMGRKLKSGVLLEDARKALKLQEGEKIIGSAPSKTGKNAHFFIKDSTGNVKYANRNGSTISPERTKKLLKLKKDEGSFNYTPVYYFIMKDKIN